MLVSLPKPQSVDACTQSAVVAFNAPASSKEPSGHIGLHVLAFSSTAVPGRHRGTQFRVEPPGWKYVPTLHAGTHDRELDKPLT